MVDYVCESFLHTLGVFIEFEIECIYTNIEPLLEVLVFFFFFFFPIVAVTGKEQNGNTLTEKMFSN